MADWIFVVSTSIETQIGEVNDRKRTQAYSIQERIESNLARQMFDDLNKCLTINDKNVFRSFSYEDEILIFRTDIKSQK